MKQDNDRLKTEYRTLSWVEEKFSRNSKHPVLLAVQKRMNEILKLLKL